MKLVRLKNVSGERINIAHVHGLALGPGETTKVHPATVKHPAVARYIGRGLELVEQTDSVTKEEPKAPVTPKIEPPKVISKPVEPIADKEEKTEGSSEPETKILVTGSLRETLVSAPGITESNIDSVLEKFPTQEALANASRTDLADAGVNPAAARKLIAWVNKLSQ